MSKRFTVNKSIPGLGQVPGTSSWTQHLFTLQTSTPPQTTYPETSFRLQNTSVSHPNPSNFKWRGQVSFSISSEVIRQSPSLILNSWWSWRCISMLSDWQQRVYTGFVQNKLTQNETKQGWRGRPRARGRTGTPPRSCFILSD